MFTVYCVTDEFASLTFGNAYEVEIYWKEHPAYGKEAVQVVDDTGFVRVFLATRFSGQPPAKEVPAKRSTDPATSRGKAKINKYEQAVLDILSGLYQGQGYTGKQIATLTGHPLNCITPRFAPLCRKGKIKDSGERRDRQIVWVLNES